MKRSLFAGVLLASLALARTFTLEQVLSAPFPSELIAAAGRGNQFRGKGRREHLLQGEGPGQRQRCQKDTGEQRAFHVETSLLYRNCAVVPFRLGLRPRITVPLAATPPSRSG